LASQHFIREDSGMRGIYLSFATVALMACSENGLGDNPDPWGDPKAEPEVPEHVQDAYIQSHPTKADVLFVISNWWSMEQAYAELVDSFDDLLEVFLGSGVDYHIGVISTDTDHQFEMGKLHEARGVRFIDSNNQEPLDTFAEMATMDASGCVGPRRPRDATFLALEVEGDEWNEGFRREDASMHTVFVSDDRDVSVLTEFEEWVGWYNTFTDTPEIDTLSAIVDFAQDGQNVEATDLIGGAAHPIQQKPWENVLEEIGLKAQGLRREYFLSRQPVEGTVALTVVVGNAELRDFTEGTIEAGGDWTYNAARNSVQFNTYEPPTDSQILIDYDAL
jgi:hypothetical protein